MYFYQFSCYMKGSCTLWRPGSGADNCIRLKMSKTWGASVHLLLFLIDRHQFLPWCPGAMGGSEMGSLGKIVRVETHCYRDSLLGGGT